MDHPALGLTREERKDQVRRIRTVKGAERQRIAQSETLCARAQVILSEDPHKRARWGLSRNKDLLPSIVDKLSRDPNVDVRRLVAQYQPLTTEQQNRFLDESNGWVHLELARNRDALDYATVAALALHKAHDAASKALWREEVDDDLRRKVASTVSNQFVLGTLARHRSTPVDVLEGLAGHLDPHVITGVAANENTPLHLIDDLVERVCQLPYGGHEVGASNTNLTEAQLRRLASRGGTTLNGVLRNPNAPRDLVILHLSGEDKTRAHLAATNVPDEELRRIARLSNLPDRVDDWSTDHPYRDEIRDLASSWSGTYNELLEALELTRR